MYKYTTMKMLYSEIINLQKTILNIMSESESELDDNIKDERETKTNGTIRQVTCHFPRTGVPVDKEAKGFLFESPID